MPMSWNDKADARLLIGILNTSTPKIDYPKLADFMGPECTEIAVKRRIQRLREQVHGMFDGGSAASLSMGAGEGEGSSSAPATPEKRKRGRAATVPGAKAKSPTKKAKAEAEAKADEEVGAEDGSGEAFGALDGA